MEATPKIKWSRIIIPVITIAWGAENAWFANLITPLSALPLGRFLMAGVFIGIGITQLAYILFDKTKYNSETTKAPDHDTKRD